MVAVVNSVYGGLSSSGGISAAPATPVNTAGLAGGGGQSISSYLPPVGGGTANFPGIVGDSNPPTGNGSRSNFGGGDAGPPNIGPLDLQNISNVPKALGGNYVAATQYIVEQFTNTATGQSWYVPRSTNNVSDGLLPIDPVFQQQYKLFGPTKFKKVIAFTGGSASDLVTFQTTLNTIVKNTQTNAKANAQNYLPPRIALPSLPLP